MLADGNLREAEELMRRYLRRAPTDFEAMRVLAQVAHQNEFSKDADNPAGSRAGREARLPRPLATTTCSP